MVFLFIYEKKLFRFIRIRNIVSKYNSLSENNIICLEC